MPVSPSTGAKGGLEVQEAGGNSLHQDIETVQSPKFPLLVWIMQGKLPFFTEAVHTSPTVGSNVGELVINKEYTVPDAGYW